MTLAARISRLGGKNVKNAGEYFGRCSTATGWSSAAVMSGPNCTFVGRRTWHHTALLVGSCARNVRHSLEQHAKDWLTLVLDMVAASRSDGLGAAAIIFDDAQRTGDPDGTRAALLSWAAQDNRIRLLLAHPLLYPRWSRTQRLALCRNMIAHEAARLPGNSVFLALDLDCQTPPASELLPRLGSFVPLLKPPASAASAAEAELQWDALTANTRAASYYYDRWALRSRAITLDYDCWFNRTQRSARGACPEYAITIDPAAPSLAVDSAFNGLGLYRANAMRVALAANCRYRGTKNSYLCEHVPFHLCMRQQDLNIGVVPSLAVDCGATAVAPLPKRVAVQADGSVSVVSASRCR